MIKIDIKKAFDTLNWKFITSVLRSFVFSDTFTTWITTILDSGRISIILNGSPVGFFSCAEEYAKRTHSLPFFFLNCLGLPR